MHLTGSVIDSSLFLSSKPPPDCGASASFLGWVRNHHGGREVMRLRYDCYEALAEKEIARIQTEIQKKYECREVRILHRIGMIEIGEVAVAIQVNTPHRNEAFLACREAIEQIKKSVPIWKQEFYRDGSSEWVLCAHRDE